MSYSSTRVVPVALYVAAPLLDRQFFSRNWSLIALSTSCTTAARASPQCKVVGFPPSFPVSFARLPAEGWSEDGSDTVEKNLDLEKLPPRGIDKFLRMPRAPCTCSGTSELIPNILRFEPLPPSACRPTRIGVVGAEEICIIVWRLPGGGFATVARLDGSNMAEVDPLSQSSVVKSVSAEIATLLLLLLPAEQNKSRRKFTSLSLWPLSLTKPSTAAMHRASTKSKENGISRIEIPATTEEGNSR